MAGSGYLYDCGVVVITFAVAVTRSENISLLSMKSFDQLFCLQVHNRTDA